MSKRTFLIVCFALFVAGIVNGVSLSDSKAAGNATASPWFVESPRARTLMEFQKQLMIEQGLRVKPEVYGLALGEYVPMPDSRIGIAEFFHPAKNKRLKLAACTPELLQRYEVAGIDKDGNPVWSDRRKSCYKNEQFVMYRNDDWSFTPLVSLACGNPLREKEKQAAPAPATKPHLALSKPRVEQPFKPIPIQKVVDGYCPMGKNVNYWVWSLPKIPKGLREQVKRLAALTEEFVTEDNSRTLGGQLRDLHAHGKLPTARGIHKLDVEWIKVDPNGYMGYGTDVVSRRNPSIVSVTNGYRKVYYDPELFDGWELSVVVPSEDVDKYISPSLGDNGRRELRSFTKERMGVCGTNVHFVVVDKTQ